MEGISSWRMMFWSIIWRRYFEEREERGESGLGEVVLVLPLNSGGIVCLHSYSDTKWNG